MDFSEDFKKELESVLNKYGIDNELNMPDFILADNILRHIDSLKQIAIELDSYYGDRNDSEDNGGETDDSFALASAGRGTDEDYGSFSEHL